MALTADALDAAVLRRCFWPASNAPLTQTERLAVANEEIMGNLWPRVHAAHADYYSAILDQAITNGQQQYALPRNAYGAIKDVTIVDDSGNEFSVALIDAEELGHGIWIQRYYGQFNGGGLAYSMYFEGDSIRLRPVPIETRNTLRIRYYRQPSALCLVSAAAKVTARANTVVAGVTIDTLTVDTNLTATLGPPAAFDLVSGGNAHQLLEDSRAWDLLGASSVGVNVSKGGIALPATVGDYVSVPGTSPLVQLPDFMQLACIRGVAAACLEASKDVNAPTERSMAEDSIELALETAIPRVEGEPKLLITSNTPYRAGRTWGRW